MSYSFDPPKLSLEPQNMQHLRRTSSTSRPQQQASAAGGSFRSSSVGRSNNNNFQTSSNNYIQNTRPISTGGSGYPSARRADSTSQNNNNPQLVATQERIIQNLKQQVDLLQKEASSVRRGSEDRHSPAASNQRHSSIDRQHLPPAGTPATHAVVPLSYDDDDNHNMNADRSHNFLSIEDRNEQQHRQRNAQIAGQFSNDVAMLRQRHAELEKTYGEQLNHLRKQLEEAHTMLLEADLIDPRSLSGPRLMKRNPNDARQRLAADERQRQHSIEVIELQKQVDRANSQLQIKDQEITCLQKERDSMEGDMVSAKDNSRAAQNEIAMQRNQIEQLQKELRLEQEQRHVMEDKLNSLQRNIANNSQQKNQDANNQQVAADDYETKIKQLTAQLSVAKCEAESAKMAEEKWRNEIQLIAQQNAEYARTAELARDASSKSDALLKDTAAKLEDCEAQREFLQLTVDRMRVEETSVNARHHQLENILRAERENNKDLEKKLNRVLEDKESAMRALRQRETDQQRRDAEDTKMRAQAKYAIDTSNGLKKDNEELRHKVADLTRRLETAQDMQTTERSIQSAIQRMEQAKYDMQNILTKQIRVAHDVSGAISAMPKKGVHSSPASRKAASELSARAETVAMNQSTTASESNNNNVTSTTTTVNESSVVNSTTENDENSS